MRTAVSLAAAVCLTAMAGGSADAALRCGIFGGHYSCVDASSGTGGKVFQQMHQNEQRCGYFDPGCYGQGQNRYTGGRRAPYGRYVTPTTGPAYRGVRHGPVYVAPGVGPGYSGIRRGPVYVPPKVGPGLRQFTSDQNFRAPQSDGRWIPPNSDGAWTAPVSDGGAIPTSGGGRPPTGMRPDPVTAKPTGWQPPRAGPGYTPPN